MWLELDKANVDELSYLAAVGRALALGQHFEFSCKRILSALNIAKSIRDGDSVDLDYWGKHMDEFVEDRLADAIRKYIASVGIGHFLNLN